MQTTNQLATEPQMYRLQRSVWTITGHTAAMRRIDVVGPPQKDFEWAGFVWVKEINGDTLVDRLVNMNNVITVVAEELADLGTGPF